MKFNISEPLPKLIIKDPKVVKKIAKYVDTGQVEEVVKILYEEFRHDPRKKFTYLQMLSKGMLDNEVEMDVYNMYLQDSELKLLKENSDPFLVISDFITIMELTNTYIKETVPYPDDLEIAFDLYIQNEFELSLEDYKNSNKYK